jgi:hypothetical protein
MVTPDMILARLPPYQDEWALIKQTQYVPDIISEVVKAHVLFRGYYDRFADLFYNTDPGTVTNELYDFCHRYLSYKEEPVKRQTSALPTGIIYRGYITGEGVDCKHYSLFNAGVLGSLNRLYNCCFEGRFLFVGYGRAKEPYHVFVSVQDSETDIWLDPTPGSGGTPTLVVSKPL